MSNTLLTPTIIADATRVILENNLVLANKVYRDDEAFTAKIGDTHTIRLPNRYEVTSGKALNLQDNTEPSAVITMNLQKHVGFTFDSKDLTLTIEEYAARYIKPAMAALANAIEVSLAGLYQDVWHSVGTPGTTPSSWATSVQLVGIKQDQLGVPKEGRCLVMDPKGYHTVAGGLTGLAFENFRSQQALDKAYIQRLGQYEFYQSENIVNHTVGSHAGTPLTEGAGAAGDVVTDTDGWDSGAVTLNKGDVFTIADMFAVNPQSRASTAVLQDHVVTTAISDTSGDIDIPHAGQPQNASGAYQRVDAVAADGKAIVVKGTASTAYPQNLAFHRDAFALAMADLVVPQGVNFAAMSRYKGISVRILSDYNINNDEQPMRIDVLYGVKAIYPELAVRLWG